MKTKTVRQTVVFKASPHDVYEALMDSRKHSAFTGGNARISRKVGGRFSVWDGSVNGINLALVPDKKIVQKWRSEEEEWPKGHYSRTSFLLEKAKTGTRLRFVQTCVPLAAYESIKKGWHAYYWNPMKMFFGQ